MCSGHTEKSITRIKRTFHNDKQVNLSGRQKKFLICMHLTPEFQNNLKQKLTELKDKTDKSTVMEILKSLSQWLESRQIKKRIDHLEQCYQLTRSARHLWSIPND